MPLSGEGSIEATAVRLMGDPGGRSLSLESHQGQHGRGREDRKMRLGRGQPRSEGLWTPTGRGRFRWSPLKVESRDWA